MTKQIKIRIGNGKELSKYQYRTMVEGLIAFMSSAKLLKEPFKVPLAKEDKELITEVKDLLLYLNESDDITMEGNDGKTDS